MNWLEKLFGGGSNKAKDKVKNHQACNFGITKFNKGKRSREFVEEIKSTERRKGPKVKPTDPPPPPPPPPPGVPERGVVLIDFDGATINGTSWNWNGSPIVCEHSGLTLEEQAAALFSAINHYSPFNAVSERILLTTDPEVFAAAPTSRRSRIVVTESWEWYGEAGGVAFVNSFGNESQNVGFVFSSLLGYGLKYIAEAISHELGHQLGCTHQAEWDANCVKLSNYYAGANGEAPIMGVPYYQPVAKWWTGPTPYGCNDIQNDAAVIAAKLG